MSEEAAWESQAPPESATPSAAPATAQQEPSTHANAHGPATAPDNEYLRRRVLYVSANQPALLRLPSGMTKQVVLEPGKTVSIGKFGSFAADDVIGRPYGPTYEIQADGQLQIMHQDVAEALTTNENIFDDGESQSLSYEDIKALKEAGATGRLEGNKSYDLRTTYSRDKIMKRKEAKHLKFFTPLPPDLYNVAWYNFERHPDKIRWLRPDALSQLLSFADVRAGGKYLVVDGVGGLLTGAILERMGGSGSVHLIHDADSPPALELLPLFNLTPYHTRHVLHTMHWAATEGRWTLRSSNVAVHSPQLQVLPARTHPDMSTSASGGYILHAVRILSDDDELDENDSSGGPAPPPATDAAPEA
ncbi:hypothetical protein CBS9595_000352 [Malassezia furfur]|nr:hypothetical protein CBS9595_000352 [Malassezia furfur]